MILIMLKLSINNVVNYLQETTMINAENLPPANIQSIPAKNYNLLVTTSEGKKLLVKQERHDQDGKTAGEFQQEWKIYQKLQEFPNLIPYLPQILHFDENNSLLVFHYLDDYKDLSEFYLKENDFPEIIAKKLGEILALLHRNTYDQQDLLTPETDAEKNNQVIGLIRGLERITPEIFGLVPTDGLKFFALYQRYDSLGQAINELGNHLHFCCLTHNDLKLNNILIRNNWSQNPDNLLRIIDWERATWGDPAFDLGMLISSYLQVWLNSLVISNSLTIEESLRLANTPLEEIRPSLVILTQTYLQNFPEILSDRSDFLIRVMQFAGLALIMQIQAIIQYQKSFGNSGIAMLQVAKSLLCKPENSIGTVFGMTLNQLLI
jgi:serine/threonine protein kinase